MIVNRWLRNPNKKTFNETFNDYFNGNFVSFVCFVVKKVLCVKNPC